MDRLRELSPGTATKALAPGVASLPIDVCRSSARSPQSPFEPTGASDRRAPRVEQIGTSPISHHFLVISVALLELIVTRRRRE
jgi:hypothetical protein